MIEDFSIFSKSGQESILNSQYLPLFFTLKVLLIPPLHCHKKSPSAKNVCKEDISFNEVNNLFGFDKGKKIFLYINFIFIMYV